MKQRICLKLVSGSCETWKKTEPKIDALCKEHNITVTDTSYYRVNGDCEHAKTVCIEFGSLEDKLNAIIKIQAFTRSLGIETEVISAEDISKTKVVSDMTDLLSKVRDSIEKIRKRA